MTPVKHPYVALEKVPPAQDLIYVLWTASGVCNQKCSYCHPRFHDGKTSFPEINKVIGFLQHLLDSNPEKRLYLVFSGGEPTLWKDIGPFLTFCREQERLILELDSNGSRHLNWWKENLDSINFLVLSYHWEFANQDRFIELLQVAGPSIPVHVSILALPEFFEQSRRLMDTIQELAPECSVKAKAVRLAMGAENYPYTLEQKNWLLKHGSRHPRTPIHPIPLDLSKHIVQRSADGHIKAFNRSTASLLRQNRWKGWKCFAGIESFSIDVDGSIYRATCRVGGSIGNLHEEVIFPRQPVICDKDNCVCLDDI
ncbi:MAG: 4Fe-4S cluster-binding domain-containing protein [Bdellovibrionales bacterium]|nr:4Fe-4S cluster-binding domain-containing protein [Bdellovibrionales bacterium]